MKQLFLFIFFIHIYNSITSKVLDTRPFIEENKVWTVGRFPAGGTHATTMMTYYFDGDTIVNGTTCKRWMCDGNLVFPVFEQDRKVWFFRSGEIKPELLYDFSVSNGDSMEISLTNKTTATTCYIMDEGIDNKSGNGLRYFTLYDSIGLSPFSDTGIPEGMSEEQLHELISYRWYEGIGSQYRPDQNVGIGGNYGNYDILLNVKVGDEVIYQNPDYSAVFINNPETSDDAINSKSPVITIDGRHLKTPPVKGIYIQNGKKILKPR